ncbi:MAG: hypothetical protein O7E57_01500 [Gammaproteobacteria bacterium]|nr:hypothetical protein [Gammaproteobacteria bacterium]
MGLYCFVGLGLLVQGIRYIGASELMPYHSAVIGTPWETLSESYQTLLLGLLKGFGAGSFCVGLAIIILSLIPFRAGSRWARWAIPAVAATYTAALVYVTSFALLPGAAPIKVTTVLLALVVIAAICSAFASDPRI